MIRFDVVKYHFEGEEDRRPDYHLGRIHLLFRMHHKDLSVPCVYGMEQRDCDQCGGAWRDFALVRRMMPAERKQTGRFPYLSVEKQPAGDFDPAGERDKLGLLWTWASKRREPEIYDLLEVERLIETCPIMPRWVGNTTHWSIADGVYENCFIMDDRARPPYRDCDCTGPGTLANDTDQCN